MNKIKSTEKKIYTWTENDYLPWRMYVCSETGIGIKWTTMTTTRESDNGKYDPAKAYTILERQQKQQQITIKLEKLKF